MAASFSLYLFLLPALIQGFSTPAPAIATSRKKSPTIQQTEPGWRVALNIGREGITSKNPAWAASGARMPVVVECDFDESGKVLPRSDFVSFTGPNGAEVYPVEPGEWKLKNERELEFTLEFPKQMTRRDVTLGPGTVTCRGNVYTQDDLKELNDQFYQARNEKWKAGADMNAILDRQEAPKKWDEASKQWVVRYPQESILTQLSTRAQLFLAQQKENLEKSKRPNPKELSLEAGVFPGVNSRVFMYNKDNKVKEVKNGPVVGSWSAEPITNTPVSYRGA